MAAKESGRVLKVACDETCCCSQLIQIITTIKSKKEGQYYENIIKYCEALGWNSELSKENIQVSVDHNMLRTTCYRGKTSYRLNHIQQDELIHIQQDEVDKKTTTPTGNEAVSNESFIDHYFNRISDEKEIAALRDDYEDFKKSVFQRLASIEKAQMDRDHPRHKYDSDDRYVNILLESLRDRIIFLENQISVKDNLIEKCIESNFLTHKSLLSNNISQIKKPMNTQEETPSSLLLNRETTKPTNHYQNVHKRNDVFQDDPKRNDDARNNVIEKQATVKKSIKIIGDSIISNIDPRGLGKMHAVKVLPHSGSTTEDMIDYIKPSAKKTPDVIIMHAGTNDLTNDIDTVSNLGKIANYLKKTSPKTKFIVSTVITRDDRKGLPKKVITLNNAIKSFCVQNNIEVIDNNNMDMTNLGQKKLHLNRKGNGSLAKNFINCINRQ